MNKLSGMTVNERLYVTGLLPEWEAAVQDGNRERLKELLRQVELNSQAPVIIEAELNRAGLAK